VQQSKPVKEQMRLTFSEMKMEDMSEEKLFHYGKVKNYKFIIFIVY
jgi:hypothetical protein